MSRYQSYPLVNDSQSQDQPLINRNGVIYRQSRTAMMDYINSLIEENAPGTTFISDTDTPATYSGNAGRVPVVNDGETGLEFVSVGDVLDNVVQVTTASDLSGTLDSAKLYLVTRAVDMGSTSITVPSGGLNIQGWGFDVSSLYTTEPSHTLFVSDPTSGNLLMSNITITTSGASSQVFDLTGTGVEALEFKSVNFIDCTSRGTVTDYRQGLDEGCGYIGGTPELTLDGAWNGYRISTSIALNMDNMTALFIAGGTLTMDGRFITDINCDLPATGALLDFAPGNINRDESLILDGCRVTRNGAIDPSDTTIYPNIDQASVKSSWSNNTGLPNTRRYIKGVCTSEVLTTISAIDTYTPLLGTITVSSESHFDEPANGEFRLLTGTADVNVIGDITIDGTSGDTIDLRVTKSTDDGATFPTEINHVRRVINNLAGADDVAFFSINFIATMNKNDRIRIEVENKTSSDNVTQVADSYIIVQAL